jgi:DNA polymerase III subunit epsilon
MIREQIVKDLSDLTFTAIDFETANEQRHSICAIGVVNVINGAITGSWKQYVRPPELRIAEINQAIHRINLSELIAAPTFQEVWEEFRPMIEGRILVAHNAEFDVNALEQTLDFFALEHPEHRSLCSLKLAQRAFPELDDYRLVDVCRTLGLEFRHHNCDEDARVCAEIAIRAIPRVSIHEFDMQANDLTRKFTKAPSLHKIDGFSEAFADKDFDRALLKPKLDRADPAHPFYAKRLVFTGDLQAMPRSDAAERVRGLGADINTSISKKTQVVVMGNGAGPSKLRKIEELKSQGVEIWVIEEDEFLRLVS